MANQEVSPVQIQMAAAAGVQLLGIKELQVPLEIAKGGALAILEGMLGAIARGELVVGPNPELQQPGAPTPPEGDGHPPGLERIEGGKAD